MNGKFVSDETSLRTSQTLATVTGTPRRDERERLASYLQHGGEGSESGGCVLGAVDTSEFLFNH